MSNKQTDHTENFDTVTANEVGELNISEDVIASIVSLAASEVEGVQGLCGTFTSDIGEFFGMKSVGKGVKTLKNDDKLILDISIIVRFGVCIPEVAGEIQKKIKDNVEVMTGLNVVQVNIFVEGIEC